MRSSNCELVNEPKVSIVSRRLLTEALVMIDESHESSQSTSRDNTQEQTLFWTTFVARGDAAFEAV